MVTPREDSSRHWGHPWHWVSLPACLIPTHVLPASTLVLISKLSRRELGFECFSFSVPSICRVQAGSGGGAAGAGSRRAHVHVQRGGAERAPQGLARKGLPCHRIRLRCLHERAAGALGPRRRVPIRRQARHPCEQLSFHFFILLNKISH